MALNPFSGALSAARKQTGIQEVGFGENPLGWIGHNWFGGRDQQQSDADQAQIDALINTPAQNPYNDQPNPYAPNNPGVLALLAQTQGGINRNFADAGQAMRRNLAQRGALGTAQEASVLRQLTMDRARALSGAQTAITADNYDRGANYGLQMLAGQAGWDADRRREQLSYLADRRDRHQQQADAPKSALMQLAGLGVKAGTAYATGGKSLMGGF